MSPSQDCIKKDDNSASSKNHKILWFEKSFTYVPQWTSNILIKKSVILPRWK